MDCYNTDSVGGGAVCAFGLVVFGELCAGFDSVELVSFLGWVSLHGLAISVGGGMVGGVVVWVLLEFWVCLVSLISCGVGII